MYRITKVALLSVSLLVVSAGAIAGNIPAIGLAYPQINKTLIELLTTLPSLFIILTVLISPKIAKKIGYKKTVQLGIVFVLIAGMLPVVTTSFVLLFMSRVLFGVGVGLFNPLLYSFAAAMYRGKELASVIGLQSAFEGIGGMLVTFLVGQLLLVNLRISFTAYLIACPILFFFSFLVPEASIAQASSKSRTAAGRIPLRFAGYLLLLLITVTIYMSVTVKVTALLMEKGIGQATAGSNLLALVGLGAMLAGMFFGRIFLLFKEKTIQAALFVLAFAMFLLAFSQTIWLAAISAVLCGFGFRTFIPYLLNEVNQQSEDSERNTSLLLIVFNLGAAFAPISIAFFQKICPFLHGAGLFIGEGVLLLILVILMGFNQKHKQAE